MADEMSHNEFLKAQFFSSDEEFAAAKAASTRKPRRSRKTDPEILALKAFCRAMEGVPDAHRRAAILYLADRYLGMKPQALTVIDAYHVRRRVFALLLP